MFTHSWRGGRLMLHEAVVTLKPLDAFLSRPWCKHTLLQLPQNIQRIVCGQTVFVAASNLNFTVFTQVIKLKQENLK